ncbi:hypothetical protein niasHT_003966 [Heterodera trifolii]|uniref:Uncharacterized protein n=1 Tax=Heterodera trifolii TaxID=157864 RepID=A0ABD2M502_9BILA
MSPNRRGTTTVRHRKPNNEQQQRKDGPTLKRTMSALGVAALTLGAGPSVEAGRPLGAKMEQTIAPPPPGPMQMNRNVNSSTLAPPPPATEGTLAPPPPATEGALAPTPPAGGLVITGYPSANPDDYFGKNANEPKPTPTEYNRPAMTIIINAESLGRIFPASITEANHPRKSRKQMTAGNGVSRADHANCPQGAFYIQ